MDTINTPESATENSVLNLSIWSKAKTFVQSKAEILKSNVSSFSDNFLGHCTFSQDDRKMINDATLGQYNNETRHEMKQLMVTGKNIKALYTRQTTLDRNPTTDISLTVNNFVKEKDKMITFPTAIHYAYRVREMPSFVIQKYVEKKNIVPSNLKNLGPVFQSRIKLI